MVEIYERFHKRGGLQILAVPCNQFAGQEPRTNRQIYEWARKEHAAQFPILEKQNVQGPKTSPLFRFLRTHSSLYHQNTQSTDVIPWNFAKFLVYDNGTKVKYYHPDVVPNMIIPDIEKALDLRLKSQAQFSEF
jgi:glutathione peroxidase